jgi:hypothetical protein
LQAWRPHAAGAVLHFFVMDVAVNLEKIEGWI